MLQAEHSKADKGHCIHILFVGFPEPEAIGWPLYGHTARIFSNPAVPFSNSYLLILIHRSASAVYSVFTVIVFSLVHNHMLLINIQHLTAEFYFVHHTSSLTIQHHLFAPVLPQTAKQT